MRVYDYVSQQTVVAVVLCQQVSWSDNEFLLCNCISDKNNYCYYHDSFVLVIVGNRPSLCVLVIIRHSAFTLR